ncbi:MAG: DUF4340 domain-containing protein [Pirellulales bacterium]
MTENGKTIAFVGIGVAAVAVALLTRPSSADLDVKSRVGEVLTKKFVSPTDAKRLRIVRVDEGTATRNTFEVAEKGGLWTMPSKDDYPADATKQMAEAANCLMDRKILEVKSEYAGDHQQYGVIDPLGPKLEVGQKGVGTRVTVSDAQDQPLVDMIIGQEVKESPGKHYVRVADQALVYVIEVDPSHLSTKFEDWIEKDLLKLSAFDLQQVEIKDYSAQLRLVMGPQGRTVMPTWDPRAEMTLGYNDRDSKWNAIRLRAFDPDKKEHVDFQLAEDEELNATSLSGLKTALDDLKIVDVVRKPQGLSQDLKAGDDFMNNGDALQDLMMRGFTGVSLTEGGPREIISSDGEAIVTMKNGTEYVLRFGDLVQVDDVAQKAPGDDAAKSDAANADAKKSGIHRYLFAMARFNEAAVKKPELEVLPDLPAGAEAKINGEAASAAGAAPTSTTPEPKTADKQPEESLQAPQVADDSAAKEVKEQPAAQKEPGAEDAALAKIIADRKRIETENQRKLDEYQATLKKGRDNVKDLNLRFGDWYFVVDNDIFTKIRLSRDAVIKKKEKKADAADGKQDDASALGAPGTAIPGLPNLPGRER